MTPDLETIEGKFDVIDRNLKFLDEYKSLDPNQFMSSYKDIQAAKYSLLETVEACIDIANHIISVKGFRRAEGYGEMFEVLKEEKVIGEGLAAKLKDMAGFRNLLVHRYGKIDDREVLNVVKQNLEDVVEFEKEVERYIKGK